MFENFCEQIRQEPKSWLVTGAAGFIGSNLLEGLLNLEQSVVGLDNYSTGKGETLEEVRQVVRAEQWKRFTMLEGDVGDIKTCSRVCQGVDVVLHQAALASVPGSMEKPLDSHASNVTGFLNLVIAAKDCGVKRFVYASSCAVYGDDPGLPKVEGRIGRCLSPYAVTKLMDELYAEVASLCYGLESVGLRYFNVFGPRQDAEGAYAAVIPKWIEAMIKNEPVYINGDGETSRDFCYVANVVQANLLAALTERPEAVNQVYNVGAGERTTLNGLFQMLKERLSRHYPSIKSAAPVYREFRAGDVRHSCADISKARGLLGYEPKYGVAEGLDEALEWYRGHVKS